MKLKNLISILMSAILVAVTACGVVNAPGVPPTLAVEPTRTSAPPVVITATTAPTTVPTTAPVATNTAPPTNTAGPTSASATNTVAATATSTSVPATATRPLATATSAAIPIKYGAPSLVEPDQGAVREYGKVDLVFAWQPVGDLGLKECYQLDVSFTNPVDGEFGHETYITQCSWVASQGNIRFVLNRHQTGPNYSGYASQVERLAPTNVIKVKWFVRVVLDQGPDPSNPGNELTAPLSPASEIRDLTLNNVP